MHLDNIIYIGSGIFITLQLLMGGIFFGLALAIFMTILRYKSKVAAAIITCYISIFRGTPVILQLSLFYFALPQIFDIKLEVIGAGIITFGLNSAAYLAEILRSGINSLPKGQFEAAKSLDIPIYKTWKDIILPQAIRNVLPSLTGEMIALLKETALISTIGGLDIMRKSQAIASEHFIYFTPLIAAGTYYYAMVVLIEFIGKRIEKKYAHY
jgi:polar amino acid transport system permease protein